jgi:hypothetical protein
MAEATLSCQAAQVKLKETLPHFADDVNYLDLYSFVIDLGAGKAPFLNDLRRFHEKFVDPTVRRIRLAAFQAANMLPLEWPHLKVALVKFVYCEGKIVQGFCSHLTAKQVRCLFDTTELRATTALAEDLLQFFHVLCDAATKTVSLAVLTKFFWQLGQRPLCHFAGPWHHAHRRADSHGGTQTGFASSGYCFLHAFAEGVRCLGSFASLAVPGGSRCRRRGGSDRECRIFGSAAH